MLAFRVCRITATLFHRAFFLLIADFLAGPRWFFINFFTAIVDCIFASNHDYSLYNFADPKTFAAALGFCFCWWMAHYLCSKQMWYNGVLIELFFLIQLLGQLSNFAFTTSNQVYPILTALIIYLLVGCYRHYIAQLRLQDPEQTLYRLSQLRKPFVPRRALQLIQVTPLLYSILHFTRDQFDDATYFRVKYSLGMADALVFVGINLDFGLAFLTRVMGTLRHLRNHYSWRNLGYFCRFNITGSYHIQIRDIGWMAVPGDQMQLAWILYWVFKVLIISFLWTETPAQYYFHFLFKELLGNFVSATATIYLLCIAVGFILASVAAVFTLTADVMACSSVCLSSYDTVQHIRWISFTTLLCPHSRHNIMYYILYAFLPLCGHMIQNIGEAVRQRCCCRSQSWLSACGGIIASSIYVLFSVAVYLLITLFPPHVANCYAYLLESTTAVWIGYNGFMAFVELVTIVVYQGLADEVSKDNLSVGVKIFRNCMAGLMVVILSGINIVSLAEAHMSVGSYAPCGYRIVVHNIMQIIARLIFFYVTVTHRRDCGSTLGECNTDSVVIQQSWGSEGMGTDYSSCGLCYDSRSKGDYWELQCGHLYHKECFDTWRNCGSRCPVCRMVFRRAEVQPVFGIENDESVLET
ncbi:uncharacterized protein LOC129586797 [Paramacrobiotus metropolitanus]|uniref:uncharacterized protein LOC129586797 n=1 Tax=Paramacrobiotus metropolitanus TaxID=2943436 RepID=UPI0024464D8A|nr:uncharacterized protein LOC129586797 [Paramacrobiotus metropolitanus]